MTAKQQAEKKKAQEALNTLEQFFNDALNDGSNWCASAGLCALRQLRQKIAPLIKP